MRFCFAEGRGGDNIDQDPVTHILGGSLACHLVRALRRQPCPDQVACQASTSNPKYVFHIQVDFDAYSDACIKFAQEVCGKRKFQKEYEHKKIS